MHLTIHAKADSTIMASMARRMGELSDFFLTTSGAMPRTPATVAPRNEEHHAVLDAIRRSDPDGAHSAMHEHIYAIIGMLGLTDAAR